MTDVILDDRIAERRREVRRTRQRRRLRRTVGVVVLLVVVAAAVLVERSGLVALEEVRVTGVERLSEETVLAAADLPLGTSTVRLRLGAAEERVEALPLVAGATARRVDPLTVEVAVTEREPVLVAVRPDGRSVLVDVEGVIVGEGEEPGLTPIALSASGAAPEPGERVEDHPALANAHAVAVRLAGPLGAEVARYEALDAREVDLLLADGRRVRFGAATRIDEKVRALGAVLEDLGATDVSVIDVRAPSTPTVTRTSAP